MNLKLYYIKKIILFCFFLCPILLIGQVEYRECYVTQTDFKDTTKWHVALIQRYNAEGEIIYEKYDNYKTDYSTATYNYEKFYKHQEKKIIEEFSIKKPRGYRQPDSTKVIYEYQNDNLIKEVSAYNARFRNGQDSSKIIYEYKGQNLIKKTKYKYHNRTKKSYIGCEPKFPKDFQEKKWYSIGGNLFNYNEKSQLIEKNPSDLYFSSQKHRYEYDEQGRIIKTTQLGGSKNRIVWTEITNYEKNKKTIILKRERYGKPNLISSPNIIKHEFYSDENKNLIKELHYYFDNKEDKFKSLGYKIYKYNEENKLIELVSFGKKGEKQIKHEYGYQ